MFDVRENILIAAIDNAPFFPHAHYHLVFQGTRDVYVKCIHCIRNCIFLECTNKCIVTQVETDVMPLESYQFALSITKILQSTYVSVISLPEHPCLLMKLEQRHIRLCISKTKRAHRRICTIHQFLQICKFQQ